MWCAVCIGRRVRVGWRPEKLPTITTIPIDLLRTDSMPPILPPITIGIVTYNSEEVIGDCIECLEVLDYPDYEVIFVDNDSSDSTRRIIRERLPGARLVRLPNRGPNPARNQVLRLAAHRYVLLVDDDVIFGPDSVRPLVERMRSDPLCGLAMPRIVFHRDPDTLQYGNGWPHFLGEVSSLNGGKSLKSLSTEEIVAPLAPGLFLLVDREKANELGGFDEYYFFGKEDSDFAFRMTMAGYRNVEVPASLVQHNMKPRGLSASYYQVRNRWYWLLKLFSGRTLMVISPALLVHEFVTAAFLLSRGRGRDYLRALANFPGDLPRALEARRETQSRKKIRDREMISGCTFQVRGDVIRQGSFARHLLEVYDRAMSVYWQVAHKLL